MARQFKFIRFFTVTSILFIFAILILLSFGRIDQKVKANGVVEPLHLIEVKSQVSGLVDKILIQEGELVKKGQQIIILNDDELVIKENNAQQTIQQVETELKMLLDEFNFISNKEQPIAIAQARENLQQATIKYEQTKQKFNRAQELYSQNLISLEEYQRIKVELELAESALNTANEEVNLTKEKYTLKLQEKTNLIELKRKQISQAKELLNLVQVHKKATRITTPISGKVITTDLEKFIGSYIQEGQTILQLCDVTKMRFLAQVNEHELPKLEPGQPVNIFLNAFPHREYKVFKGKLISISPKPVITDRGIFFEVKIDIIEPWVELPSSESTQKLYLKPGLTGRAEIIINPGVRMISLLFRKFQKST